jgi:hypothetical protein
MSSTLSIRFVRTISLREFHQLARDFRPPRAYFDRMAILPTATTTTTTSGFRGRLRLG